MRIAAVMFFLFALTVMAPDADARARRSLRVDFGSEWGGFPGKECDPVQTDGTLLHWRGFTFSGYQLLPLNNTYCQTAPSLSQDQLFSEDYAAIRALIQPGESISATRTTFVTTSEDFCCTNPGDAGFQWVFFRFDDAIIAGLFGPVITGSDFLPADLAVNAGTTFLKSADGTVLWDGANFDGEWLCFRTDGTFAGAVDDSALPTCRGGVTTAPALPLLSTIPDVNASGTGEVVVLHGSLPTAEILEGDAGAPIDRVRFMFRDNGIIVHAMIPVPDSNADGIRELAVLATRQSDGAAFVQVRNVTGSVATRNIALPAGFTPIDITSAGDGDNNGIIDVGALMRRTSDRRGFVFTRNLSGDAGTVRTRQASGAEPLRVIAVPDADGNGTPSYAVLSRKLGSGRALLQVTPVTAGSGAPGRPGLPGKIPLDMSLVPDTNANGIPEIGLLLTENSRYRAIIQIFDAVGSTPFSRVVLAGGKSPLRLTTVGDSDADGVPELAVLSSRDSDGAPVIESRGADNSAGIRRWLFSNGLRPQRVDILPDYDANGVPELALLASRNADSSLLVLRRNAAGNSEPFSYLLPP